MIKNKDDLQFYLQADKFSLNKTKKKPNIFSDEIWKFQICLRKYEYFCNSTGFINRIMKIFYKLKFHRLGLKLGFSIPINVFEPGLSIAHYGNIVVNKNCKIGKNCRIHEGVTIGATGGSIKAPKIGNNVFIGTGAKIIGDIELGNGIVIGAGSVVVSSFKENNITVAGVPAKKISNNDSTSMCIRGYELAKNLKNYN